MLCVFAFKLAMVAFLPYIYIGIDLSSHRNSENIVLVAKYSDVPNPTDIYNKLFTSELWSTRAKIIENITHAHILVDFPPGLDFCAHIQWFAPSLPCRLNDPVSIKDFNRYSDPTLVRRGFSLPSFNFAEPRELDALITSGAYDYQFLLQSFWSQTVNLTSPIVLADKCEGCQEERDWGGFFAAGTRDTIINFGVHYAIAAAKPMISRVWTSMVTRVAGSSLSVPVEVLDMGVLSAAAPSTSAASSVFELAPLTPIITSTSSGVAGGMISHSYKMGQGVGYIASALGQGLTRTTSLPAISSGAPFNSVVRAASTGALSRIVPIAVSQESATVTKSVAQVVRSTIADVFAAIARWASRIRFRRDVDDVRHLHQNAIEEQLRTEPLPLKRRGRTGKRETGRNRRMKRGAWDVLKAGLRKLPEWAWPTGVSGLSWGIEASVYLRVDDISHSTIYPIQHLARAERFYITAAGLIFSSCFHNETIKDLVRAQSNNNITFTWRDRTLDQSDVVYNLKYGLPGDTLRTCSPFFSKQSTGLGRTVTLETLSVLFDTSIIIEDLIFYNGPSKLLVHDYVSYYNDVYPRFRPSTLAPVDDLPRNPYPARGERDKRSSYTLHSVRYDRPVMTSEGPFTDAITDLISTPRFVYEFDIIEAGRYNTSYNYYKDLRYYIDTSSINRPLSYSPNGMHVLRGISMREVLRGLDPFNMAYPRLNILRELISGADCESDYRAIVAIADKNNQPLEFIDNHGLVALKYLVNYPTDTEGYQRMAKGEVERSDFTTIVNELYRNRYMRIPLLIIVDSLASIKKIKNMFVIWTRDTSDIKSWKYYSPIMITDQISLIQSGSYSLCITKMSRKNSASSLFGLNRTYDDDLRVAACDLATLHITYEHSLQEILANPYVPPRVLSLLSIPMDEAKDKSLPDVGPYDPIMSEFIEAVKPGYADVLRGGVKKGHTLENLDMNRQAALVNVAEPSGDRNGHDNQTHKNNLKLISLICTFVFVAVVLAVYMCLHMSRPRNRMRGPNEASLFLERISQ